MISPAPAPLDAHTLWADVLAVREQSPLVHNITNFVVMQYCANALLAVGASPVMAHAREEVQDMANIARALVLNIGTLAPDWVAAMKLALESANARGTPVVLDPVGAGATPYRDRTVADLLAAGRFAVVRGNASEILRTAGQFGVTKGVDSTADTHEALDAAHKLARRTGSVVCVSGRHDHVVDPQGRHCMLSNGHEWMTRVTGVGCSASALVGAFCAVQADAWRATAAAMALMGLAGEWAAQRTQAAQGGVGRLQTELIDALHLMDRAQFLQRLHLYVHA